MLKLLPLHRVSTQEQAGQNGQGLDRQRYSTETIAKAHGAILLPAVELADVSGSDVDQTPEWAHVLRLVADPDTHLVVDAIDRLLRADAFNFRVMRDLLDTGTKIYMLGKVVDLSSPEDGFMAGLFALLGGREKAEIKKRIQAGREAARRRGEWPFKNSGLPRGLAFDRQTKKWSYTDDAKVVLYCYDAFVQEGKPLHAIARVIGKPMQTVSLYLKHPIYKGILRWDKKRGATYGQKDGRQGERKKIPRADHEVIEHRIFGGEGQPAQLVTDELWDAAQRRLTYNATSSRRARDEGRPDGWASGFMRSALATEAMWTAHGLVDVKGENKQASRHVIYLNGGSGQSFPRRYSCACCRSSANNQGLAKCGMNNPMAAGLNANLDVYLTWMTSQGDFIQGMRDAVTTEVIEPTARKELLEVKLKKLDEVEGRVRRLYLNGRSTDLEHDTEQDRIRAERHNVRKELEGLDKKANRPDMADIDRLDETWRWDATWDAERKRAWLQKYVREIGIDRTGVRWCSVLIPTANGSLPAHKQDGSWDFELPITVTEQKKAAAVAAARKPHPMVAADTTPPDPSSGWDSEDLEDPEFGPTHTRQLPTGQSPHSMHVL